MAETILEVVTRYAQAWAAGDLVGTVGAYADDFVLHYGGAHALSGTHRGKPAALAVLAEFSRRTARGQPEILDVMAGAARGVIVACERLGPDGTPTERVLVYRVADGRLAECWVHDTDSGLIDRLVGQDPP